MVRIIVLFVLASLVSGDSLSVSISPLSTTAGTPFTVTVAKLDSLSAPQSDSLPVYLYSSSGYLVGTTSIPYSSASSGSSNDLYFTVPGTYSIFASCSGYAQDSASITISVGTETHLKITTQPSSGSTNCPITIAAVDQYGNSLASATPTVYLTLDSASAGFSMLSSAMSGGSVTFSTCKISGTGTFRFIASASSYGSVASNTFTVSQTLTSWTLAKQSESCLTGNSCKFTLTMTDSNGVPYMASGVTITITKSSGSGTVTFSPATLTTLSAVNTMTATFSSSGSMVLTASCSGCTGSPTAPTLSWTILSNNNVNVQLTGEIKEATSTSYVLKAVGKTPTSSISVAVTSSDVTVTGSPFDLNSGNSYTATVSISVPYLSGSSYTKTVTINHAATSSDSSYQGNVFSGPGVTSAGVMSLPVYVIPPTITVESQIAIQSQSSGTYQVSINIPPTSTLTLTLTTSGSISVSPTSLSFTSSSYSAKTVTVTSTASQTSISTTGTITHAISASDSLYSSPIKIPSSFQTSVTILGTSFASLVFNNGFLSIAYLESGTYTLKLKSAPTSDVTVTLASSSQLVTLSPTTLTFTSSNYGTAQTITASVSAAPANLATLSSTVILKHTTASSDPNYSGLIYETVIQVINTCESAVYDWLNTATCSATINYFVVGSGVPSRCNPGYSYSSGNCIICPAGSYCPDGRVAYTCPAGHYTTTTGNTYCSKVSPGYYYTSTTSSGTAVGSGSYSNPRAQSSTDKYTCQSGNMCPYTSLDANFKCSLGQYSAAGSTSCTNCPAGSSCSYSSASTCSNANAYSPVQRSECFYCSSVFTSCTSSSVTLVTAGNQISSNTISSCTGNIICTQKNNFQAATCPLGSYMSATGKSCMPCSTSGYSCSSSTATSLTGTTCSTPSYAWGLYCLGCPWPCYTSSSTCVAVPSGKYYNTATSASTCSAYSWAPGGYNYCSTCSPGYSCNTGSTTPTSNMCTTGNICAPSSITQTQCSPSGTYSDQTGLADTNQCKLCEVGYQCSSGNATTAASTCNAYCYCPMGSTASDDIRCLGGTHSTSSSRKGVWADCTIADYSLGKYAQGGYLMFAGEGYFSADMLSDSGCPYGTYQSNANTNAVQSCVTCPTNSFCPRQSPLPTLCNQGWTIAGSQYSSCIRCTFGKLCPGSDWTGNIAGTAGYFYIRGTYANTYKMTAGYYITSATAVSEQSATECTSGSACPAGSSAVNGACTANFYCPQGVPMSQMFACPLGKFTVSVSAKSSADCGLCSAGNYCMLGNGEVTCPAGFYCPSGTISPEQFACPDGTYLTLTGKSIVTDCTACPAGSYCPTTSTINSACPYGTFRGTTGGGKLSDCTSCTAGYYCSTSGGTVTPTQCGAGFYCDTGSTAALICKSGYFCSLPTMTSANMYSSPCPGGYLCPYGVSVNPTTNAATYGCSAGYYCPSGLTYSIPCRPGTYVSTTASSSIANCLSIPQGFYSDTYASSTTGTTCPAGYYCPLGTTQPIACPAGTFNANTGGTSTSSCIACTAGNYCPYVATVTPTVCPAGSYCISGVSSPTLCPAGTYGGGTGLASLSACTKCDPGKYCDTAGLTAVKGNCAAGYYCKLASITATPDGQSYGYLCPAGSYCPAGCTTPQSCPAGTFNNYEGQTDQSGCIKCPEGNYCKNAVDPFPSGPCDPGYYCGIQETSAQPTGKAAAVGTFAPGGTPAQINCPVGTYQSLTGQASCTTCDAGSYCPSIAMSAPTVCPVGFYCPAGCVDPIPCPPGTFRSTPGGQSLNDCAWCTAGKYCANYGLSAESGLCAAGYFCEIGSPYKNPSILTDTTNQKYGPCQKGYYCLEGTTLRTTNPCLPGTYNPANMGTDANSCLKCTAGRFCPGNANIDDSNVCPAQYYCPESTSTGTANPCPAGSFCVGGTDYNKLCFPGTYSSSTQSTACTNCPAGSFCVRGTSSISASNICPAGYYCPLNTVIGTQFGCPPGTFSSTTGLTQKSDCSKCTDGYYCDKMGLSNLSSNKCAPGFFCNIGSNSGAIQSKPMDDSGYGGSCKRGNFCPQGSSAATICTAGSYCHKDQMSAVSGKCQAGFYCNEGATVPNPSNVNPLSPVFSFGDKCPAGFYCPLGSGDPTPCPAGKYMIYTGAQAATDCMPCPPGYVCPVDGMKDPVSSCPTGYSCVCPAGYFCASGVSVGTTSPCDAGFYCPQGSFQKIPCDAGTYQDLTAQSTCKTCPLGSYCELGASSATPCPAGYYCPAGTGYRFSNPCPPGTFNPNTGASAVSACQACTPGKYCLTEGLSAVTGDCAGGYYCSTGAIVSTPPDQSSTGSSCARGTFCVAGSSSQTSCTAGSYCIKQGLSAVSGVCNAGYYCLAGSITPVPIDNVSGNICPRGSYCPSNSGTSTPCPAGTFGPAFGLTATTDCTSCSLGNYCATTGLVTPTGLCTAGYYCDGSSTSPTQKTCTAGNYCPTGSFAPVPCDMGKYQSSTGQSSCLPCQAGYYCDKGSSAGTPCLVGYSCSTGTNVGTRHRYQTPCQSGTYSSTTGQSSCTACPAGYMCPIGSSSSSTNCPLFAYCPLGTGIQVLCPAGTYNNDPGSYNLKATTDCTPCPPGKYCVDGRISAPCEAGYLCTGGSPTPTPVGTNAYGGQCPIGGYCTQGAVSKTACPTGKFNTLLGGMSINDCNDCPPGYFCAPGSTSPTACPKGYYCPQGVEAAIACPIRTYNSLTLQDSQNSCLVCPGGYMCTQQGTSDYTLYPCGKIGAYCVQGAQSQTPCPPGTWSNSTTAASVEDCNVCTEGYMCPGGSNIMLKCLEGTYCPTGSPFPLLCLIGYYCPAGSPLSIMCPKGFYCPKYDYAHLPNYVNYTNLYYNTTRNNTQLYIPCPQGYACPAGSFAPTLCTNGYYASNDQCVACPGGTYSNSTAGCKTCSPGFICVHAATRPDPMYLSYQGGYICPSGYYCLAGATSEIACPPGSYNPLKGQSVDSVCKPCPINTYTDSFGNPTCFPCGSSAIAGIGNTTCVCLGANRNYLKSDGTCRCIPQYQFISQGVYISDQDGTTDCFKKVYAFQPKGQVRDPAGTPKDSADCSAECAGGQGTRLNGVGICECSNVTNVDNICNKGCRDSSDSFTINGGIITHTSSQEQISLGSISGYFGKTTCISNCKVYSMNMKETGPEAVYGGGDALAQRFNRKRRLVSSSPGISNPVVCISLNETYIFSVSKTNYPIYLKDSLINTNGKFDYGAFTTLNTLMTSSSTSISIFAFTFSEQGIYDFIDSGNSNLHIIISVIGAGQQCPDPEIPIRTRTTSSMLTLGTQSTNDIISDPDWTFIILTVIFMILIVILLILAVYVFEHHKWVYRYRISDNYRELQMNIDFEALTRPEPELVFIDESGKEVKVEPTPEENIAIDEMVGNDDIDPTIFKHMQKLLEDQKVLAENTFHNRFEEGRRNMADMLDKISKIKKFLRDSLEGLEDGEASEEQSKELSPEEEVENLMAQLAENYLRDSSRLDDAKKRFQEILNDPNLSDKDKKDLMNDFSVNMIRLDEALVDEQNKASELLSKRLTERKKKKEQKHVKGTSFTPIEEEPSSSLVSPLPIFPGLARKNTNESIGNPEDEKAKIAKQIEDEKNSGIKKMREELSKNLKEAKSKREQEELMEDFNRKARELESRAQEERERQEADLARRLKNRKLKQPPPLEASVNEESDQEFVQEGNDLPKFFEIQDQEKVEILKARQEEVRQNLIDKQIEEKQALEEEFTEVVIPIPRDLERQKLESAMKNASSEAEKKALMSQLGQIDSAPDTSGQKESLQARLNERKRLKAQKEAELKRKHQAEQEKLDDRQDEEIVNMTNQIAQDKIAKLINSRLDPEDLTKRIKEMIDEKQQIELDQLLRKKQETLTQRQTNLLQDSLTGKAEQLTKIRHDFAMQRNQIEISALTPNAKFAELKALEKQESDLVTQLDYNFVNGLGREQNKMWRSVEDEFRQKFLDLGDKHLQETAEILRKMREVNPALLQSHLREAERATEDLKRQIESDYNSKVKDLDSRQLEFLKMQGEKEQEIDEIRRQLEEAEAKKKELFEVERMRKEMQERQRQMIEEMRRRGIRPEQMEEMIKKHQQEMTEWEAAMERERLRQKEKMQERLNARMAKYQEKMAQKLAKFKEETNKAIKEKEEEKLEIKFPTGRQDLIFEPVKNIDTKLRVNPLPVFVRGTVSEYADYSNILQKLLMRVKRIERMVAIVDLDQFGSIMEQLDSITSNLGLKKY